MYIYCMKESNYLLFKWGLRLFKGLCLLFLPKVPGAMFIQGGTFIPDSRVLLAYKLKSSGLLGHKQHPNLIYWLHQISNLTMLAFAALSPYLYVFRSRKVQKCLGQVIYDTFCCCGKAAKSGFSRPQCVIFAKLKFTNLKT